MNQILLPGLDPVPFAVAAYPGYKALCYIKLMCPVCFPFPVRIEEESSFVHGLWESHKDGRLHYSCGNRGCHFTYTMPDKQPAQMVWGEEIVAKLRRQWGKELYVYVPWGNPPYQNIGVDCLLSEMDKS